MKEKSNFALCLALAAIMLAPAASAGTTDTGRVQEEYTIVFAPDVAGIGLNIIQVDLKVHVSYDAHLLNENGTLHSDIAVNVYGPGTDIIGAGGLSITVTEEARTCDDAGTTTPNSGSGPGSSWHVETREYSLSDDTQNDHQNCHVRLLIEGSDGGDQVFALYHMAHFTEYEPSGQVWKFWVPIIFWIGIAYFFIRRGLLLAGIVATITAVGLFVTPYPITQVFGFVALLLSLWVEAFAMPKFYHFVQRRFRKEGEA